MKNILIFIFILIGLNVHAQKGARVGLRKSTPISTNNTLNGNGTSGSPLRVDTAIIATVYDVSQVDQSSSNELQSLVLAGSNLTITGRNTVALPSGADNMGNMTATANLNMSGFNITNGNVATFDSCIVTDAAYGAGWNGSTLTPTRNAVYDKMELKWELGGQNIGANANIGSLDNFRVGISTNGTPRVYFSPTGRFYSSTLTDFIQAASDSALISGTTIDIAGAVKITGNTVTTGTVTVPADAYDATSWNGSNTVPTKDAVRDKIESLGTATNKFTKGGDGDGANLNLGTTDAFALNFVINNVIRGKITSTGIWDFDQATLDDIDVALLDSIYCLNPRFFSGLAQEYQSYTTASTLNRKGVHYVDGTADVTVTTDPNLPDRTVFTVKNNDGTFNVTVAAGSGNTTNGNMVIGPGNAGMFQKRGTVIERLGQTATSEFKSFSGTTDASGDLFITHSIGSGAVPLAVYSGTQTYVANVHTITSTDFKVRIRDLSSGGAAVASTAVTVNCTIGK